MASFRAAAAPLLRGFPSPKDGQCSAGLPNGSVRARFLWVARQLGAAGLYVMPDFHLVRAFGRPDGIVYDPDRFVAAWAALAKDLAALPELQGKLALDFVNEPDGFNLTWSDASPELGGVTMTELYLRVMDAAWGACKNCLFVAEGSGQSGVSLNWGDGFVTNATYLDAEAARMNLTRLANAGPFLTAALARPWVNQLVLSPHFYCPRVTTENVSYAGPPAFAKWSRSTGGLQTKGHCAPGGAPCRPFPLMNGAPAALCCSAAAPHFPSIMCSPAARVCHFSRPRRRGVWHGAGGRARGGVLGVDRAVHEQRGRRRRRPAPPHPELVLLAVEPGVG